VPHLVEFQRSLATDVLFDGAGSAKYLCEGPVAADLAIRVHRDSVLAALVNAIRLSCPTFSALVDVTFFEQSVHDYARARPPGSACLADFGYEFGGFLEMYPPASGFPFFGDIVRFDIAVDKTSHDLPGTYGAPISLGAGGAFRLLTSLTHISTRFPVDAIRDEVEAGRFEELERLDMKPRVYHFALWRGNSGASVKRLTEPAAAFLTVLLQGGSGGSAVKQALEHAGADDVLRALQSEILTPPVCIISSDGTFGEAQ